MQRLEGQWGTDVQLHDFFVTSNIQTDDPAEVRSVRLPSLPCGIVNVIMMVVLLQMD